MCIMNKRFVILENMCKCIAKCVTEKAQPTNTHVYLNYFILLSVLSNLCFHKL